MTTETLSPTQERSALNNRLRAMVTQENIITLFVGLIVAGAVIVPLAVLFVSSFKVLDPLGWDTTWASATTSRCSPTGSFRRPSSTR